MNEATNAMAIRGAPAITIPSMPHPTRTEYISVTDTAKLLRSALKHEFPGIKFSVRSQSYSGGASIDVRWTDGPAQSDVEEVASQYQGSGFDGSIDLKYGITHWLAQDGTVALRENRGSEDSRGSVPHVQGAKLLGARPVRFGSDHVSCQRDLSPGERIRMIAEVERIGQKESDGTWGFWFGDKWVMCYDIGSAAAELSNYRAKRLDVSVIGKGPHVLTSGIEGEV